MLDNHAGVADDSFSLSSKPPLKRMKSTPSWFRMSEIKITCAHPKKYGFGLCRSCYDKERHRQMPVELRRTPQKLKSELKSRYGLALEDYNTLLKKQGGVCAICRSSKTGIRNWRLHVDHDHRTGKVRGLLCSRCNLAIGHLKDREELFERAIIYLSEKWHTKYYRAFMLSMMMIEVALLGILVYRECLR